MAGPLNNITASHIEDSKFKELDDLVISEEEESEEIEMPTLHIKTIKNISKEANSEKETNTGTVQHKSSQM
jgi:hypothetical protein